MYHKPLHIFGDFCPQLGFVGNRSTQVFGNGNPNLLAGLYSQSIGLHRIVRALVGIDNDILHIFRHIGVVPTLGQNVHFLSRPSGKGIGSVIRPRPQAGFAPALGHLDSHRHHGYRLCVLCQSRHRQHGHQEHCSKQNSD